GVRLRLGKRRAALSHRAGCSLARLVAADAGDQRRQPALESARDDDPMGGGGVRGIRHALSGGGTALRAAASSVVYRAAVPHEIPRAGAGAHHEARRCVGGHGRADRRLVSADRDRMKPAPLDYLAVSTAEEALAALARFDGNARLLAGGQSLVPL